jgi:hypothetical protein
VERAPAKPHFRERVARGCARLIGREHGSRSKRDPTLADTGPPPCGRYSTIRLRTPLGVRRTPDDVAPPTRRPLSSLI